VEGLARPVGPYSLRPEGRSGNGIWGGQCLAGGLGSTVSSPAGSAAEPWPSNSFPIGAIYGFPCFMNYGVICACSSA